MTASFFERPIIRPPYEYPGRHWELDKEGHPTYRIIEARRCGRNQEELVFDAGDGLSTEEREYTPAPIINEIRGYMESGRNLPKPEQWQVRAPAQPSASLPVTQSPPLSPPDRGGRDRDPANRRGTRSWALEGQFLEPFKGRQLAGEPRGLLRVTPRLETEKLLSHSMFPRRPQ